MVFDDNLLYEIENQLIDEVTITSEYNHSGFHVRRGKLSPDLVLFYLEEIVGWQLPGKNPTRTYAISLWPQGAVINMGEVGIKGAQAGEALRGLITRTAANGSIELPEWA